MKQTINRYEFHRAFEQMRPDNFTYEALDALFDYFEQYEQDTGEEMGLDVIGICCDYTQSSFDEVMDDYKLDDDDDEGSEAIATRYLEESTTVVAVLDDSIVFCSSF
jgi:hypothetical protein